MSESRIELDFWYIRPIFKSRLDLKNKLYFYIYELVGECVGGGMCITLCSGRDKDDFGESTDGQTMIWKKT